MPKRSPSRSAAPGKSKAAPELRLFSLPGIPEIQTGDDLVRIIADAVRRAFIRFENGDVLVIAQKIVSKAEGALVNLARVTPSPQALTLAEQLKKDPRAIEVVLQQSRRIVRSDHVLITETYHGFVCANAGVDHSNVPGDEAVTLLPKDPDRSAKRLAVAFRKQTSKRIAIIISDTFGRPWRLGLTDVAIGAAGVPVLLDLRGTPDRHGKLLNATILAVVDELAAAAGLLMDKSKGSPVVLIRGYRYKPVSDPAAGIIRPAAEDLFR
jgi:coenzyme F420-0:L-glutamate ligase / coenzyme F420-1:gamma-L-glutamate ligase